MSFGVGGHYSNCNQVLTEQCLCVSATKGMETLDEAATSEEKLDLELADGLKIMASYVDDGNTTVLDLDGSSTNQASTTEGTEQLFQLLKSSCTVEEWDRQKYETTMKEAIRLLSADLPRSDEKRPAGSLDSSNSLCYIREFVEEATSSTSDDETNKSTIADKRTMQQLNDVVSEAFTSSAVLYRTLLLREAAQTLLDNWDTLTNVTSGDVDRAAIEQVNMPPQRSTIKSNAVQKVFEAYGAGSSQDWVQAWWGLIDNDGDGLIDETEMNSCIELSLAPVHRALEEVVALSLEACPARTIGLGKGAKTPWFMGGDDMSSLDSSASNNPSAASNLNSNKLSWRNRRAELKTRALLLKTFRATLARHFRDQVETPHRLRCIYAWAEKGHQNNKIDSIHVDASEDWGAASSIVGKKRYVELEPKISYPEFRKEQERHFPHLDKMGEEIAMSFKEDLWVLQGKRRQNEELKRQCFYFLLGVSIVDLGIGML